MNVRSEIDGWRDLFQAREFWIGAAERLLLVTLCAGLSVAIMATAGGRPWLALAAAVLASIPLTLVLIRASGGRNLGLPPT